MLWAAAAALAALHAGDHATARAATRALGRFSGQLVIGRPGEPDRRTARDVSRFVTPRAAGRGKPPG